jgi:diguanylate cyclase (GGDEF)-like protein
MSNLDIIRKLASATSYREVACLLVERAIMDGTAETAHLVWGLAGGMAMEIEPYWTMDEDLLSLARASCAPGKLTEAASANGWLAIPLGGRRDAAMLLRLKEGCSEQAYLRKHEEELQALALHLDRVCEVAELRGAVARTERSEKLQSALFAISDLSGSSQDLGEVLVGIHKMVDTLMYAANLYIVLYDAERDAVRFLYYADEEDPDLPDQKTLVPLQDFHQSLTWYLIRDGKPIMGSTEHLRSQVSGPLELLGPDSKDWMGVPMIQDGKIRGALVVQSYTQSNCFSKEDHALLEFVGSHILTALDRKHDKDEMERRVTERTADLAASNQVLQLEMLERQRGERLQAALFGIAQLAGADLTQGEFYSHIHKAVGGLINTDNFFIGLVSDDGGRLDFPYYVDASTSEQRGRPLGKGMSEYVLQTKRPILASSNDIMSLVEQGLVDDTTKGSLANSWVGVPLFVGEQVIGLIVVQTYEQDMYYTEADLELLVFVASQIANSLNRRHAAEIHERAFAELENRVSERTAELRAEIVERERIQEQLKHQVMHDPLTALPNRAYMREQISRTISTIQRHPAHICALLYLDVDRFKLINDSLGHLAGDQVLKEVSRRLLTCVRPHDVVGRLSGDEFAILLENLASTDEATHVANRIIRAMAQPMIIAGRQIEPSASVGIAMGNGRYRLADDMLRDADTALYRAKAEGRNRFEVFDEAMHKQVVDVLMLEGELKVALQQDQFEPYFQPIIRLKTNETVGYEALIRWNHPERGVMAPGEFIGVAQASGSLEAIDWRMFELSCSRIAKLTKSRPFLTINVSPEHLRRPTFDARLMELLDRTDFNPARLMTEITEGSLLHDPEHVRKMLDRLQALGVGAALDDFGTGYSSLGYLHTFPLRMLKIDRSFVSCLDADGRGNSTPVVTAVLALAAALEMDVVAEGIETEGQRQALIKLGCDMGQGYLLGRPAPIEHWVDKE